MLCRSSHWPKHEIESTENLAISLLISDVIINMDEPPAESILLVDATRIITISTRHSIWGDHFRSRFTSENNSIFIGFCATSEAISRWKTNGYSLDCTSFQKLFHVLKQLDIHRILRHFRSRFTSENNRTFIGFCVISEAASYQKTDWIFLGFCIIVYRMSGIEINTSVQKLWDRIVISTYGM